MGCQGTKSENLKAEEFEFDRVPTSELKTKYDKIVHKLSKIKTKASILKAKDVISDIDWILTAIRDKDLHEPEFSPGDFTKLNGMLSTNDIEAMNILAQYSNGYQKMAFVNDTEKINMISSLQKKKKPPKYAGFINKFKRSVSNILNNLEKKQNFALKDVSREDIEKIAKAISQVESFEFNIFVLEKSAGKHCLYFVLNYIYSKYGFFSKVNEKKFISFAEEIINGYNRTALYHNDLHGTDVCQTTFLQLEKGAFVKKLKLNDLDILATVTAAACHDFRHNGFNNNFQVLRGTDIAITFNDQTVLENYHVSETFKVILSKDNNIFEGFSKEEYRHVRRRMIDCILSTDMTFHSKNDNILKSTLSTYAISNGQNLEKLITSEVKTTFENQQLALSQCVHTADLSNAAKISEVFDKWTDLIYQEFFNQGDVEKSLGLTLSNYCDRTKTKIATAQVGFINHVVLPHFEIMINLIPEITWYRDGILSNLERYKKKAEEENDVKK